MSYISFFFLMIAELYIDLIIAYVPTTAHQIYSTIQLNNCSKQITDRRLTNYILLQY